MKRLVLLCLAMSAAAAAVAQSATPLDLSVPEQTVAPAATAPEQGDPPGTYYGDTTGRMDGVEADDGTPRCDDATYNKPQVHGSVTTGVVSSSHGGSGNYQAGAVNLSQAFGSCEHPTGGVSISVGAGQGHFGGGRIR